MSHDDQHHADADEHGELPHEHPLEEGFDEAVPDETDRRLYPSTFGGVLYLLVLAATLVGLGIVALKDWRLGITWIGGALIAAAVCRLLLPRREAGMLEVRHRLVDVVMLGGVGATVIFLARTIPNQPL